MMTTFVHTLTFVSTPVETSNNFLIYSILGGGGQIAQLIHPAHPIMRSMSRTTRSSCRFGVCDNLDDNFIYFRRTESELTIIIFAVVFTLQRYRYPFNEQKTQMDNVKFTIKYLNYMQTSIFSVNNLLFFEKNSFAQHITHLFTKITENK